jgi:hypothetical protein
VEYAETALKISEEISKRNMSPIGKIWQTGMLGGMGAAGVFKPELLVPYGFSAVAAWRIMQPKSAFKKWLTQGLEAAYPKTTKVGKEALKVGGRAVTLGYGEE